MSGFGQFWFVLVIGVMGTLWIVCSKVVNEFIVKINEYISAGTLSTQYVTWWQFTIGMFSALLLFVLLGASAWAYNRSIEQKSEGGL